VHDGRLGGCDLYQKPAPDANVAEFACVQQKIDRIFHTRAGHKIAEEQFDFLLVGRDDAIQIF
jgi:hypothetical protein